MVSRDVVGSDGKKLRNKLFITNFGKLSTPKMERKHSKIDICEWHKFNMK